MGGRHETDREGDLAFGTGRGRYPDGIEVSDQGRLGGE